LFINIKKPSRKILQGSIYREAFNRRVFLPVIAPLSSSIQTLTVGTGNEPVQS